MRIENKIYIIDKIRENIYYYFLVDKDLIRELNKEKKIKEVDYFFILEEKVNKIYLDFIKYLEGEYKIKIEDINNFREDYIYYEIDRILGDIIEDNIY